MDWQTVAGVSGAACAALVAVIWHQVSGTLGKLVDRLEEVGRVVHGHGIRLDMIEGRENGR